MRKYWVITVVFILGVSIGCFAAPMAKHLIDATPGEGVLINVEKWFADNPVKDPGMTGKKVFESPRCLVNLVVNKAPSTAVGRHIHTNVDEIIYCYKGSGEIYLNGKWVKVKAGDLHICPRGIAHTTRVVEPDKELLAISIFAPPQPGTGDRISIDD